MTADSHIPQLTVLQRLDLVLASRLAQAGAGVPPVEDLAEGRWMPSSQPIDPRIWISSLLGLRGLLVQPSDVEAVLGGDKGRFDVDHHEHAMILGLYRVQLRILDRAVKAKAPDGWFMAEMFKTFSEGVARFRNNQLRRDIPWDAILYVSYSPAERVGNLLDNFHLRNCYLDNSLRFKSLHPVRQSFRLLWHFARVAPFPDFNLTMAWVAMNSYLLYRGYPMLYPEREDRERLHRMLTGPVPLRVGALEARLLAKAEGLAITPGEPG